MPTDGTLGVAYVVPDSNTRVAPHSGTLILNYLVLLAKNCQEILPELLSNSKKAPPLRKEREERREGDGEKV